MNVADELRTANVVVIEGRTGLGSISGVTSIDTEITRTSKQEDGAFDVNEIAQPRRAVAYIDRLARVWLLSDGPRAGHVALILVGAYRDDSVTDKQADALAALLAVLSVAYGLDAPETPETVSDDGDGE